MRTMFTLGVSSNPWMGQTRNGGIPVYDMERGAIDADRAKILRRLSVPPGMTQPFPYIVKVIGEGEYLVKADGTAQFYSYKYGRWEPPQVIDNKSMWAKMYGHDEG